MYKGTITLFNRYESRLGDTWYPSVIKNVNVNIDKAAIVAKYGAESKDNVVLNIRYNIKDGNIIIGDKPYLLPKEWEKQVNEQLPNTVTFTPGNEFDFFYVGEWENEAPVLDDDYTDGFFNYMNSYHDQVFKITSVARYSVIPHFEIMGA